MKKVVFSVIVPCYNAERFVDRAVDSLISQTIKSDLYEIIFIDDASTDDTLQMLKKWEREYPETIKIVTYKTNKRQGGARNEGIKKAQGQYIAFMDIDDWIEPDALETYYGIISDTQYDIVYATFVEDKDYNIRYGTLKDKLTEKNVMCDRDKIIATDFGYFWTGVYKKDLIVNNGVLFPENILYEDIYWSRAVKLYAQNICSINKVTHHHFYNEESTMNTRNVSYHVDRLTSYELLLDLYLKEGIIDKFRNIVLDQTMEVYVINSYYMFFTRMDEIPNVYNRIRNTLFKYFLIGRLSTMFQNIQWYMSI